MINVINGNFNEMIEQHVHRERINDLQIKLYKIEKLASLCQKARDPRDVVSLLTEIQRESKE